MTFETPSTLADALRVIDQLVTVNTMLMERIAELEKRLSMTSRNSSKPPSSDGYSKPPTTKRSKSKRKAGKQPGAAGTHLAQVENPDKVERHVPLSCCSCGRSLVDAEIINIERRQVFDLPQMRLNVTEHQVERRRCVCREKTEAQFPEGVNAPAVYGSKVRSMMVYLTVGQHLPFERAAQVLADCIGAPVATGTLVSAVVSCGALLQKEETGVLPRIREILVQSPVIHADETGGRVKGRLHWLHSVSNIKATLYMRHEKRGREAIDAMGVVPAAQGTVVHDGWAPYRSYAVTHALCGAHHLRELVAVSESGQKWAGRMIDLLLEIKEDVDQARRNGETGLSFGCQDKYRCRYAAFIEQGKYANPDPKPAEKRGRSKRTDAGNLLRRLEEYEDDVLRFMTDFRVPFDNNQAERDIRMIKLQQKISGCWRTAQGADVFCAIRSYISTARKNGTDVLSALAGVFDGKPWIPPLAASP